MKHPWDWICHFAACFIVTVLAGWKVGTTMNITIEATQLEAAYFSDANIDVYDTVIDLASGGLGIWLGDKINKRVNYATFRKAERVYVDGKRTLEFRQALVQKRGHERRLPENTVLEPDSSAAEKTR